MLNTMVILFFVVLGAIIANSVIVRYSTLRSVRMITLLIIFGATLPLVVLAIINLVDQGGDPAIATWSLGILGALLAFWLKNPLRGLSD
jgi:hypothetical protein